MAKLLSAEKRKIIRKNIPIAMQNAEAYVHRWCFDMKPKAKEREIDARYHEEMDKLCIEAGVRQGRIRI